MKFSSTSMTTLNMVMFVGVVFTVTCSPASDTDESDRTDKTEIPDNRRRPGEPDFAAGRHILIAVDGGSLQPRTPRSIAAGRASAEEFAKKLRAGADAQSLVSIHSEDPGRGRDGGFRRYRNFGVAADVDRQATRRERALAYGDVLFGLKVGEVGILDYDPKRNALGVYVIKRVE